MKEGLIENLDIIQRAQANPLRQWEDDEFAEELLDAENFLEANQLFRPDGSLMLSLGTVSRVLEREGLERNLHEKLAEADQARIKTKLEGVTNKLRAKADQDGLSADVRLLLGIT